MAREPFTYIELDEEVCSRVFGVGGCPAALGPDVPRKCYGTFFTCPVKEAFDPVTRTLRYCEARPNLPVGGPVMFPVLRSVSEISATVNIAGTDADMSAFGRRATVTAELDEFPHHDRGVDPYAAERVSGAAQLDEPGYRPELRGGHFGKQRARNPYYPGRAFRLVSAYLDGGAIVDPITRHFVQHDRAVASDGRSVRIEARDVLDLAGNDRAVAPAPSKGVLAADIAADAATATLLPVGVGELYPASGRAVIGSEIVSFTRVADVLTLTARGLAGSAAAGHSAGDSVQMVLHVDGWRMDDALAVLLRDYAKVPAGFLPLDDWAAEVDRWLPQLRLQTHICKPEGVAGLVGELSVLGVSIWWDEVAQKVRLQANRPPDEGAVIDLTDDADILEIEREDRQKDRLTEIMFFTVQLDPTKSATASDNYRRVAATYSAQAKDVRGYGDTKLRRIYSRWLNGGADAVVTTQSNRLLNRFAVAPIRTTLTLSVRGRDIGLASVLRLSSRLVQDVTGRPAPELVEVVQRSEPKRGATVRIVAQLSQFSGRYCYATENTRPDYASSTAAQRARGMYACDPVTLKMSNGDEPYRAI